eukprot:SAG31_NODE_30740_length_376_cov_2.039711_1_plen_93_part_00
MKSSAQSGYPSQSPSGELAVQSSLTVSDFRGYLVFFGWPNRMGGMGDWYPPMSSRDSPIRNVDFGPRSKTVILRVVILRCSFIVLVRNTNIF